MPVDKEGLLRIAEAVADHTPVDWDSEGETQGALEGELRWLKVIEAIGAVQRTPDLAETPADVQATGEERAPAPPKRWGPLRVVERIGQGGFAEVYRAHDPKLDREVALKLLRPDRLREGIGEKRFLNEARRLARVRHPNVLTVHGADRHEDQVGLWADLLEGKTLEECLAQQGPFGAEEAARVGIDLCGALAAVHAAGLIHRDVKTANVMRETGGRIVLLDFSSVTTRTAGAILPDRIHPSGTPAFMAPELFRGRESGVRSDIYSLGAVLYRLVSGRLPVEAKDVEELRDKHRRGESTPLRDVRPDLPPTFVQVVERALAADPGERYATVGEMERALIASLGRSAPEPPRPSWWQRPAAVALAAAAMMLVAVALGRVLWMPSFEVEASLFRHGPGVEERLLPGGQVLPGDSLFLEIQGSRSAHVYVLNQDDAGDAFVLYPLDGLDVQNPLAAGVLHRLPGTVDGDSNYWNVTSAGGTETILVLASREPLRDLEQQIENLPRAGPARPIALPNAELLPRLRGIGGLSPAQLSDEEGSSPSPLSEIMGRYSMRSGHRDGVWIWEMRLSNPG